MNDLDNKPLFKYYKGAEAKQNSGIIRGEAGVGYKLQDCAIRYDTMNSLANFLAEEQRKGAIRTKFDSKELEDNDELMKTLTFMVITPMGEQLRVIVDSKGMAEGVIIPTEEGMPVHLTDDALKKMKEGEPNNLEDVLSETELAKFEETLYPKQLELGEFGERVADKELIPSMKKMEEVASKTANKDIKLEKTLGGENKAVDRQKEMEEVEKEISAEEKRIQGIAAGAGISVDALMKFCEEHNISMDAIKGAKSVSDVEGLEQFLDGSKLSNTSGNVVIVKTEEEDMKERARIISNDGETLFDNSKYDDRMAPLVPNYTANEPIRDIEEAAKDEPELTNEMEYTDSEGNSKETQIAGSKGNSLAFEEYYKKEMEAYKKKMLELDALEEPEKSREKEKVAGEFYGTVCQLEKECNVDARELVEKALGEANEAVHQTDMAELKDLGGKVLDATAAIGGIAVAAGASIVGDHVRGGERSLADEAYERRFGQPQ